MKVAGQVAAEVATTVVAKVVAKVAAEVAVEINFMFSKKATKIDIIFTVDLTLCRSKCQIVGEDFVKFCGLLRKHKLYKNNTHQVFNIHHDQIDDMPET